MENIVESTVEPARYPMRGYRYWKDPFSRTQVDPPVYMTGTIPLIEAKPFCTTVRTATVTFERCGSTCRAPCERHEHCLFIQGPVPYPFSHQAVSVCSQVAAEITQAVAGTEWWLPVEGAYWCVCLCVSCKHAEKAVHSEHSTRSNSTLNSGTNSIAVSDVQRSVQIPGAGKGCANCILSCVSGVLHR